MASRSSLDLALALAAASSSTSFSLLRTPTCHKQEAIVSMMTEADVCTLVYRKQGVTVLTMTRVKSLYLSKSSSACYVGPGSCHVSHSDCNIQQLATSQLVMHTKHERNSEATRGGISSVAADASLTPLPPVIPHPCHTRRP